MSSSVSVTEDFRMQATLIDLAATSEVAPYMFFRTQSSNSLAWAAPDHPAAGRPQNTDLFTDPPRFLPRTRPL
jgi:hypothetical protein